MSTIPPTTTTTTTITIIKREDIESHYTPLIQEYTQLCDSVTYESIPMMTASTTDTTAIATIASTISNYTIEKDVDFCVVTIGKNHH